MKTRKKIFRQTNGENDGEVGDQGEVWQTGVYANEMIKEYFEYSLNEKISRYSESVNSTKIFIFKPWAKPEKNSKRKPEKHTYMETVELKSMLYQTVTCQKKLKLYGAYEIVGHHM